MLRMLGVAAVAVLVTACASAPKSVAKRNELNAQAQQALDEMVANDPSLRTLMDQAAGYVIFPKVDEGGFIVGGSGGTGVVFQRGVPVGYAELSRASVGAQIGGQRYSELIIMRDQAALDRLKSNQFDFGGQMSATAIRAGAAQATQFGNDGVAVFIKPIGGAMVNMSVSGQRIKFTM